MKVQINGSSISFGLAALLLAVAVMVISCSGNGTPSAPDINGNTGNSLTQSAGTGNARTPENYDMHGVWGFYTMILDWETDTIEVVENREAALHLNVKSILQSPFWCPAQNCIKVQFLDHPEPDIWTIKGTLINPTPINGFDVRVIIFLDDKGHQLLNADDYTRLYEPDEWINPFRAYSKMISDRKFGGYSSFSEIFQMYVPPVPQKWYIGFAIDASWPTNCPEPYDLDNFGYEGSIYPDDPDLDGIDQGSGLVFSGVYDWQENISEVTVDTTPITGGLTYLAYNPSTVRWEAAITNSAEAEPDEYVCLLGAYSDDDPSIGIYNYLTVTVDETPPPTVQSISGEVLDSFLLYGLSDCVVNVVNQDITGLSPEPFNVTDGIYSVDVVTGTYDISVVSNDLAHLAVGVSDVVVGPYEDIHLDFGLNWPGQPDPTGVGFDVNWAQVTGFAGRVVDPDGSPVAGATIEIVSPDYILYFAEINQDFLQMEVTDEHGYFSLLNLPVNGDLFTTPLTQYRMHVRQWGYEPYDAGLFPAIPNQYQYQVITLQPHSDSPIWEETFETDTGWALMGYYHRQMPNPSIVNISFNPVNQWVYVPSNETFAGAIPPTPENGGDYYLWYGQEIYGNFIGVPDPFNDPWCGGNSVSLHSGTATSPPIDISAYSEARVEFDMAWEIESQQPAGYDRMRFSVNGLEKRYFNPFMEPGPTYFTMSSQGWNRTLIWNHYIFDISEFVGGTVNLNFSFETWDELYNGLRGQFIDNIKVYAN